MKNKSDAVLSFLCGLFLCLFWNLGSFLRSLPAWVLLILHFTVGLPIWWFFLFLGVWFLVGLLRFLLVRFARWGRAESDKKEPLPNKNPYSQSKKY